MGLFKRKRDPLTERSKSLEAEMEKVQAEIRNLQSEQPRVRSTTRPGSPPAPRQPIFEAAAPPPRPALEEPPAPEVYNELGIRKYNLAAVFKRFRGHFQGPATSNPKLVSYLAAGSIRGLRPLRYEKRVARNRFLALCFVLLLLLWGVLAIIL